MGGKMKRALLVGSVLVMAFFCSNTYAFTVSYDQSTTGIRNGVSQQTTIKIKDEKLRMEANMPQGKLITIIDDAVAYQYVPSENKAYRMMTKGPTNIKNLSDYKGYLATLNAKIVGSESVGDYDCDIYEFTDPGANVRAKAWVWRAKNFPVKYELDLPAGTVTTIMKNIKINGKIDDSEFAVPAGVEIIDMQRMIGQGKNGKN
jgi:outer membrane lipoprotein-sorting protein